MEFRKESRILVYGMSDNPGGMEAYIMYMLRHANLNEYHFDMLTVFQNLAHAEELSALGCRTYKVDNFSIHPLKHILEIRKIMKGYDVLYMNILDAGSFGTALAAKTAGKKIVVHSHNGDTDRRLLHMISRPILNLITDERYACSDIAGKHMFGKRKFVIINNEIDRSKYSFNPQKRREVRESLHIENKYVVCHVGRIVNQKNPYCIIDIFEKVREKMGDVILLYIGDGNMREEIEAYIASKTAQGLKDSIKMMGVRNDVQDLLSASDVFVLPSFYEGNPISVIEAQENGIPCIIADNIEISPQADSTYKININDRTQWVEKIISLKSGRRDG